MPELTLTISQILGISTGFAILITIAISALWAIYFNRIKEKQKAEFEKQIENQKAEFSKQLETLKAKNEKINYITKAQFDTEFKMYQELSEYCFLMVLDNSTLFPSGLDSLPENEEECKKIFEQRYEKAYKSLLKYQNLLYKYAPFITNELYLKFDELRKMGQKQVDWFPDLRLSRENDPEILKELASDKAQCWKRTKEIIELHSNLVKILREYLQTLKVMDGNNE